MMEIRHHPGRLDFVVDTGSSLNALSLSSGVQEPKVITKEEEETAMSTMTPHKHLDAHERPPEAIRNIYKKYQKMQREALALDRDIIDGPSEAPSGALRVVRRFDFEELRPTFDAFTGPSRPSDHENLQDTVPVYEHPDIPGKE